MSRHTPGPWHYIGDGLTHRQFAVYAPGQSPQQHICTVNDLPVPILWQRDPDQALANARLIAAAPDILKALEFMTQAFLDTEGTHGTRECLAMDEARAAIERATGGAR